MPDKRPHPLRRPHAWVATTYFAEGFPYTVVNTLVDFLFKDMGASLQAIGLTALFHLPWNLKFLWSPFVDQYATKRAWLVGVEVGLVAVLLALAAASGMGALGLISILFLGLAFLSATHDIAIDGFYLEGLPSKEEQSRFVGYRVTAYRVAMLVVAGPLLWVIDRTGWPLGLTVTAGLMALLLFYHSSFLPRVEKPQLPARALFTSPRALLGFLGALGLVAASQTLSLPTGLKEAWKSGLETLPFLGKLKAEDWIGLTLLTALLLVLANLGRLKRYIARQDSAYSKAFVDFLDQRHVGRILAFVILFRTGESFLLKMRSVFLLDLGLTKAQIGTAAGTVGVIASLSATILGGSLIARYGLKRCLWPFALLQNGLHLLYMAVAWGHEHWLAAWSEPVRFGVLTVVVVVEAFGAGLGTAAFMVYLMRCCRPSHKAAHMAILTALMSLSFTFAGVASGFLARWMGYPLYFGFTFVAAVPGMILIPFIPYLDGRTAADDASSPAPVSGH